MSAGTQLPRGRQIGDLVGEEQGVGLDDEPQVGVCVGMVDDPALNRLRQSCQRFGTRIELSTSLG